MYKNLQILSREKHSLLQLKTYDNYNFANSLTMVPLGYDEVFEAAKYYPIVFFDAEISFPVALLGFDNKNIFIDAQAQWLVPYVPARIRTYPFSLIPSESPNKFVVAIDMDAPHFVDEGGQPLFDGSGNATPWLEQLLQYLNNFQKSYQVALDITANLKNSSLIAERGVTLTLKNGTSKSFQGFLSQNEELINALSEDRKNEMELHGEMPLLKAHRASLVNFVKFFR